MWWFLPSQALRTFTWNRAVYTNVLSFGLSVHHTTCIWRWKVSNITILHFNVCAVSCSKGFALRGMWFLSESCVRSYRCSAIDLLYCFKLVRREDYALILLQHGECMKPYALHAEISPLPAHACWILETRYLRPGYRKMGINPDDGLVNLLLEGKSGKMVLLYETKDADVDATYSFAASSNCCYEPHVHQCWGTTTHALNLPKWSPLLDYAWLCNSYTILLQNSFDKIGATWMLFCSFMNERAHKELDITLSQESLSCWKSEDSCLNAGYWHEDIDSWSEFQIWFEDQNSKIYLFHTASRRNRCTKVWGCGSQMWVDHTRRNLQRYARRIPEIASAHTTFQDPHCLECVFKSFYDSSLLHYFEFHYIFHFSQIVHRSHLFPTIGWISSIV